MSSATPRTAGALSDDQLFRVFGSDPAQLAQIGALFVRQYDRLFEDLFDAVLANRAADMRLRLHSIKGMAALIGAAAAVAETVELECLLEAALSAAGPLPSAAMNEAVGNLQATLLPYRTWFARWLPPTPVP